MILPDRETFSAATELRHQLYAVSFGFFGHTD